MQLVNPFSCPVVFHLGIFHIQYVSLNNMYTQERAQTDTFCSFPRTLVQLLQELQNLCVPECQN